MIAMIMERVLGKSKLETSDEKKCWILNTIKSSKFPSINKIIDTFKSCDTWTRVAIVEESAYLTPNRAIGHLMAYASKSDPEEPVKRRANALVRTKVSLQKHVDSVWSQC